MNNQYTIIYEYDALGNASSFVYNGDRYIYVRNGTNDIVGILDETGTLVTTYKYDGWGNCTVEDTSTNQIGYKNPFRYRSYYYDSETGYYYLNSRYYDSNVGRFINPDTLNIIDVTYDSNDKNIYAYCDNNPVNRQDRGGDCWILSVLVGVGAQYASDVIGNVLNGKRGIEAITPSSSMGTYIAAGVTSLIPGGGIGKSVLRNTISEGIKTIEKIVNKEIETEKDIIKVFSVNFVISVASDYGIGRIVNYANDKILKNIPDNYSQFAKKISKNKYNIPKKHVENLMQVKIKMNYSARKGLSILGDILNNCIPRYNVNV